LLTGSRGKPCRYDFYFPEGNLYVEVTSFLRTAPKNKKYWEKKEKKEEYVKNELCANFLLIEEQLSHQEYKWVKKHLKIKKK